MSNRSGLPITLALSLVMGAATAAENTSAPPGSGIIKTAYHAPNAAANPPARTAPGELVLSAPPRDKAEEGVKRFGPIAEYLSTALGRKVVYRHPGTWGGYQADMQRGAYDLVFDGPHFNGWRVEKINHTVLVKLPGDFTYVAVVRRDNTRIQGMKQLAGHTICAHAPPNLGTLIMLNEFTNPVRQPVIVVTNGYDHIYQKLLEGKCEAAMLPLKHVHKQDQNGERTRIVFKNQALPQQALSAGPRLSPTEQAKITEAMLAPAAVTPLARFREAYGLGKGFVAATNQEYAGLGHYLRNEWGYY